MTEATGQQEGKGIEGSGDGSAQLLAVRQAVEQQLKQQQQGGEQQQQQQQQPGSSDWKGPPGFHEQQGEGQQQQQQQQKRQKPLRQQLAELQLPEDKPVEEGQQEAGEG
jgi:hypothetical protein